MFWHILPVAGPQLLALAGVSVSLAFAATIPVEVLCDLPGIGQLAWKAALSRDLVLLVNLTMIVTLITLIRQFRRRVCRPSRIEQVQDEGAVRPLILILTAVIATALLANFIAPASYAHQFRDLPDAAPSSQHLLGTDELGRDRLARLLYGTRVSLMLAPAAALLSSHPRRL